jgi:hypothetical protein
MSIKVKSTREGLVGQKTATGWIIDTEYPFVALPSAKALNRWVKITNPANGRMACAQVMDVGPWNEHDDAYVFNGARPAAESGTSVSGHGTNGAGIDLGEKVWSLLGMTGNTEVEWEFV